MFYNPKIHHRKSIRLKGYDYSQAGAYFITICCHDRVCLFGEILNNEMVLNEWGIIAQNEWIKTKEIRKNVELDVFIVMPNHIHGILIINDIGRGESYSPEFTPIGNCIRPIGNCIRPIGNCIRPIGNSFARFVRYR